MNKMLAFVDKYLVPVYRKDGWVPVLAFMAFGLGVIVVAVWLGFGDLVRTLFGD